MGTQCMYKRPIILEQDAYVKDKSDEDKMLLPRTNPACPVDQTQCIEDQCIGA